MFSFCHGEKTVPCFVDVQVNGQAFIGTNWTSHLYLNELCENVRPKHAVLTKNNFNDYFIRARENAPLFLNGTDISIVPVFLQLKPGDVLRFGHDASEHSATLHFDGHEDFQSKRFLAEPLIEYLVQLGGDRDVLMGLTRTPELRDETNFAISFVQESLLEQTIPAADLDYLFVEMFDLLAADFNKAGKCKMILRYLCVSVLNGGPNSADIVVDEDDVEMYFERIMVHDCSAPKKMKKPRSMHTARVAGVEKQLFV